MRVVMLSWEYPPKRVGGIAAALEGLAPALARNGVEVHVVTSGDAGGALEETPEPNLHLHRVLVTEPTDNFIHWVHRLNAAMESRVDALIAEWNSAEKKRKDRVPVVLHVHDWLGQFAGISLKHRYRLPLVSTIHATEHGRNNGVHNDLQRAIHGYEAELSHESWRVIVCSSFMRDEVRSALACPDDKMDVVFNGVDSTVYDFPFPEDERVAFRARFAAPSERLVYFIGRMVHEKGAQVLVDAWPKVLSSVPAKLVVAGGGARAHLEEQAARLGIANHVYFTGRISDEDRDRLYRVADLAVYPSLYEPFGIVALEAMAAGVPVVASDAGGLREVVVHDVTGTSTWAGDADSLAWGVVRALTDPQRSRRLAEAARARVLTEFHWMALAAQTKEVYERVWKEYVESNWAG